MPTPEKATPPAAPDSNTLLADVLSRLADTQQQIADLQREQISKREPTFDEYLARNPKRVLPFPLYLGGIRIDADQVTDADLELLSNLQDGRFFDRRIHVFRDSTPDRSWHIDWARKSMSDRMMIMQYGSDFTAILRRLTTEAPDRT